MKKEARICIRISSDLKDAFRELAIKEGYSMSEIVEAIMKYVVETDPKTHAQYLAMQSNMDRTYGLPDYSLEDSFNLITKIINGKSNEK